jgi:hypothetical protein
MHGRGYVSGGDSLAAAFIKNEFRKHSLSSFNENHYQPFTFNVNTFPGELNLFFYLGRNEAYRGNFNFRGIPAQNFLIDPSSPSGHKEFQLLVFDSVSASSGKAFDKFRKGVKSGHFILIDDRKVTDKKQLEYFSRIRKNELKVSGIIELVKKLTWDQSQTVGSFTRIQILADSFNYHRKDRGNGAGAIVIDSKIKEHLGRNVVAYVKGSVYPDSFIVFSAHYDHLGHMGAQTYFPGANDNASGCAMLLNLAKYYSNPEHQPEYSIAFVAFAGEEVGLLGSKYYTEHPLFPLKNIKFLLNMDIMGTGEEGITVVNGSVFKKEFEELSNINQSHELIKAIKSRGKAANSDHFYFSENGVKAFFIYTMGGIKAYHDIYDRPETLPLNEFEDLFLLITKFADSLQVQK